jgi:hypothetical protein
VALDRPADVGHIEIASSYRDYQFLGVVNRERQVLIVDQAEHASSCPCESPIAVDQCVIARERVDQRGGLLGKRRVRLAAERARPRPRGGGGQETSVAERNPGEDAVRDLDEIVEAEIVDCFVVQRLSRSRSSASSIRTCSMAARSRSGRRETYSAIAVLDGRLLYQSSYPGVVKKRLPAYRPAHKLSLRAMSRLRERPDARSA